MILNLNISIILLGFNPFFLHLSLSISPCQPNRLINDRLDIPVNNRVGTKRYLAPEVLEDTINMEQFDAFRRADIYAFGLVLWELATRTRFAPEEQLEKYRLPYEGMVQSDPSIEEMREVVVDRQMRPEMDDRWNTDDRMRFYTQIMVECWYSDPAARMTALRVKKNISIIQRAMHTEELIANGKYSDQLGRYHWSDLASRERGLTKSITSG